MEIINVEKTFVFTKETRVVVADKGGGGIGNLKNIDCCRLSLIQYITNWLDISN